MKLLVILLALTLSVPALAQTNKIIADQNSSPVALKELIADPGSAPRAGGRAGGGTPDRMVYLARGYNATNQEIQAVDVTFISFNAYNELIDHTTSSTNLTLERDELGQFTAISMTADAGSFHTAVAFVERVRLEDGTIWNADMGPVLKTLRRIDQDFDPTVLN